MDLQRAGGMKLLQRVVQEDFDCQVVRWFSEKITGHMSNSYWPICQLLLLVRLLTSWAFALIQYSNFYWLCGVLVLLMERDMNYQNNLSLSVVQCYLLLLNKLHWGKKKKKKNENKCLEDVWKPGKRAC